MFKISQGRVRDKGILLKSLKLVDKNKLLDCAQCTTIVSWWCALFREEYQDPFVLVNEELRV